MAHGWLGLDWGNVPGWVSSALTGSSLLIAAFTYRRSVAERGREQDDRERQQASRVSIWTVNSRKALIRNGNDVAVVVRAFVDAPSLFAASDRLAIAPETTRSVTLPYEFERIPHPGGHDAISLPLMVLDSAGRGWLRASDGTLHRLEADGQVELETRLDGAPTRLEVGGD